MEGTLRSLIDVIESAYDERTIKSALKGFASSWGFERFAYAQMTGADVRTINSYPREWQNRYLANRYSRIDPVVTEARRRMDMFSWTADDWAVRGNSELKRFRDQAIEHGIHSGITIPVEGSFGSTIALTFASSKAQVECSHSQDARKAMQAVLAIHYRLQIIGAAAIVSPKRFLSAREATCVMWAAKGKKAAETATLTGIDVRTVQHYLTKAREKLGAATIPQLVAIAKDHGLV
ncbi:autoinducer binding domain-containing protein [Rhizobium multihospitium]|uniref:DNA-binding transcriptional regulator, CsgD family n=1 Tax=Rhizobium multihospitium TaxID=410764 RepID=A0A1C3XBK9_9HYPH|nr:autoinducer binding domain-containing protein [Rhizobium multihospitium]SCB49601.1 DNA-binding transcriptional regulator, CsgD family [Rhizobium multihospitium]